MKKYSSSSAPVGKVLTEGYRKRQCRARLVTALLLLFVLLAAAATLTCGATFYSPSTVLQVLRGIEVEGATFTIYTLRLPRMLAGLLAGAAFGMAGSTFQSLLHNPLASPDIIGVTSGSSVAAVFCILILRLSGPAVSLAAVLSGLVVSSLIYVLARGGGFSNGRMILVGIGMQAMLNAVISYLLLKAAQYDVSSALRWLSGSLNGVRLSSIPPLLVVVLAAGAALLLLERTLLVMQLGPEYPVSLGVKTTVARLGAILLALFLTAFATAVTGPIASVAFLSGPIATRLSGHGQGNTIPAGLVGAGLVLVADLVGQNLLPARYPVGVITGILGAPYLLLLLLRIHRKGERV